MSQIVLKYVRQLGLNPQNMVSVSTDTASIMTGKNGGAVKYLKESIPHISHTWCLNHITNLVLLDTIKSSDEIEDAIKFVKQVASFFSSAKRY